MQEDEITTQAQQGEAGVSEDDPAPADLRPSPVLPAPVPVPPVPVPQEQQRSSVIESVDRLARHIFPIGDNRMNTRQRGQPSGHFDPKTHQFIPNKK